MEISISEDAANWYKSEYGIVKADLRFFVRYGGMGGNIPGFSLGVSLEPPDSMHTSTVVNGIRFFIEEIDAWYFEGKDLKITYNEKTNEPQFAFQ